MNKEIDMLIKKPIESDLSNWNITDIQLIKSYSVYLQNKLEYKEKLITEIMEFSIFTQECPFTLTAEYNNEKCKKCKDEKEKCWLEYFKKRVHERSKNEN